MTCLYILIWKCVHIIFLTEKGSALSSKNSMLLLLLLLSRFSRVRLCATPETAARQAPPSLGFSRQEYWTLEWVAISFSNAWKWKVNVKSLSKCPILCDPIDCSPPDSFTHGIFQARVLEWVAITFSHLIMKTAWSLLFINAKTFFKKTFKMWR